MISTIANSVSRAPGTAAVLAAAVLWGTVGPVQVLAGSSADPGALGVVRLLVGGAVLAAFTLRGVRWRAFARGDVLAWVLVAALATGVFQVAFMHAVERTGAALATAVALGVAPVATGLFARWWAGEQITAVWAAGTAAAVLGCVVILRPESGTDLSTAGVVLAIVSGLCYGAYTVAAKRFLGLGVPAAPATTLTLVVAGVVLSPLVLIAPADLGTPASLTVIAWTGVAGTALAYALFIHGLRTTSAASAGTLSLAEPLVAVALGVLVLGEHLGTTGTIGSLLLILGLVVVTTTGGSRTPAARRSSWRRRAPTSATSNPAG